MNDTRRWSDLIREYGYREYDGMYRPAGGALRFPFLTPGSAQYADVLWDWDSWLANIAIRQVLTDLADESAMERSRDYERGCVLNAISYCGGDGWMPVRISRDSPAPEEYREQRGGKDGTQWDANMNKPCLAQHGAFLVRSDRHSAWLADRLSSLERFVAAYYEHYYHSETGLFFLAKAGGVVGDNDPCVYYRPRRSCAQTFLSLLMYRGLLAMEYLANTLQAPRSRDYQGAGTELRRAIHEYLRDPRDGYFYSADLQPEGPEERLWPCIVQRIGVWSGLCALWTGAATDEQAERLVAENYRDTRLLNSPAGVQTLRRQEKMYDVRAGGSPSIWLGLAWSASN